MSVQSEITRLENAKAAIKAAIEGKGVTVPDATLLDGMASLIESIEAGGGVNSATGVLVFSEDYAGSSLEITHNLNKIPSSFILYDESSANGTSAVKTGMTAFFATGNFYRTVRNEYTSDRTSISTLSGSAYYIGSKYLLATEEKIYYQISQDVNLLKAGRTYRWFAC